MFLSAFKLKSVSNSSLNQSVSKFQAKLYAIVPPGLGIDRDPPADDIGDADEESELLCGDEVDMADDDDVDWYDPSSTFRLAATGGCHDLLRSTGNMRTELYINLKPNTTGG